MGLMPFCSRNLLAGEPTAMLPAGLMWSVVIELPTLRRQLAPSILVGLGRSLVRLWKNGGLLIYVLSFHWYLLVFGMSRAFHLSVPLDILSYTSVNMLDLTCLRTVACTSSRVGHMSFKNTSFPLLSLPIGSTSKSMSHFPANA